jgi:hypothetical protein
MRSADCCKECSMSGDCSFQRDDLVEDCEDFEDDEEC